VWNGLHILNSFSWDTGSGVGDSDLSVFSPPLLPMVISAILLHVVNLSIFPARFRLWFVLRSHLFHSPYLHQHNDSDGREQGSQGRVGRTDGKSFCESR